MTFIMMKFVLKNVVFFENSIFYNFYIEILTTQYFFENKMK